MVVSGSRWVDAYDLATGKNAWTLGGVGSGPVSSPVLDGDTLAGFIAKGRLSRSSRLSGLPPK